MRNIFLQFKAYKNGVFIGMCELSCSAHSPEAAERFIREELARQWISIEVVGWSYRHRIYYLKSILDLIKNMK